MAVTMPLEKRMWGDEFGTLVDPFGFDRTVDAGRPGG
jgi:PhnB protein